MKNAASKRIAKRFSLSTRKIVPESNVNSAGKQTDPRTLCKMRIVDGFTFYEYCRFCQKIVKYRIESDQSTVLGVCQSCEHPEPLCELKETFYAKTDLWVTRFKMTNMNSVVTGRLLHALRSWSFRNLVTRSYHISVERFRAYIEDGIIVRNVHHKTSLGSQYNILVLSGVENRFLWSRGKKWWGKIFYVSKKKRSNA